MKMFGIDPKYKKYREIFGEVDSIGDMYGIYNNDIVKSSKAGFVLHVINVFSNEKEKLGDYVKVALNDSFHSKCGVIFSDTNLIGRKKMENIRLYISKNGADIVNIDYSKISGNENYPIIWSGGNSGVLQREGYKKPDHELMLGNIAGYGGLTDRYLIESNVRDNKDSRYIIFTIKYRNRKFGEISQAILSIFDKFRHNMYNCNIQPYWKNSDNWGEVLYNCIDLVYLNIQDRSNFSYSKILNMWNMVRKAHRILISKKIPTIGGDMEFIIRDKDNDMVSADSVIGSRNLTDVVGTDGRPDTGEIRPPYGESPYKFYRNLKKTIYEMRDKVSPTIFSAWGGSWQNSKLSRGGAPLGGHLHFGNISGISPHALGVAMDVFIGDKLEKLSYTEACVKRSNKGYGGHGKVSYTNWGRGLEYKSPPSWIIDPVLARTIIYIAYNVVQFMLKNEENFYAYPANDEELLDNWTGGFKKDAHRFLKDTENFLGGKKLEDVEIYDAWKIRHWKGTEPPIIIEEVVSLEEFRSFFSICGDFMLGENEGTIADLLYEYNECKIIYRKLKETYTQIRIFGLSKSRGDRIIYTSSGVSILNHMFYSYNIAVSSGVLQVGIAYDDRQQGVRNIVDIIYQVMVNENSRINEGSYFMSI